MKEFVKGFKSATDKFSKSFTLEELMSSENIAEDLNEQDLTTISMDLSQGFEEDDASRQEWLEMMDDYIKLALQHKESKTFPFDEAANVKLPLLTIASLQFHARAFPALVNEQNLVKYKVIGYDQTGEKTKRGGRVARHMTYQLTEEMDEWVEDMDMALLILPIVGCVFKKTYYDATEGRPRSDLVLPQDIVVNYGTKRLEDAARVHHIIWRTANEIIENINRGVYRDVNLSTGVSKDADEGDEIVGLSATKADSDNIYKLIETHCFLDLDNDGYKEPYIVLWDSQTKKVLRITARFEDRLIEKTPDGDLIKITPITFFTKYSFIPNPAGKFYDMGWGLLLGPLNETANSLVNQLLDAGTRSTTSCGFISQQFRPKGGDVTMEPNLWVQVAASGDDIRKGLYPLEFPQPSPVLFQLLQHLSSSANQVGSIGEVMNGENPGQNQPFGTTQIVLEEGTKVLTAIYKRIHGSFKKELQKLFYLNSMYLQDPDYQTILDFPESVTTRQDYDLTSLDIRPASDPNIASKTQRLALARDLMQMSSQGAPLNPQVAVKMYLEAMDVDDIQTLLNVPPPPPDPEVLIKQAEFEHRTQIDWADRQIEMLKVQGNYIRDVASSIAKIMEAEALEPGEQFQQAMAYFNQVQEEEKRITERVNVLTKYATEMAKIEQQKQQGAAGGSQ